MKYSYTIYGANGTAVASGEGQAPNLSRLKTEAALKGEAFKVHVENGYVKETRHYITLSPESFYEAVNNDSSGRQSYWIQATSEAFNRHLSTLEYLAPYEEMVV